MPEALAMSIKNAEITDNQIEVLEILMLSSHTTADDA